MASLDMHPDVIQAISSLAHTKLGKRFDRLARKRYGVSGKVLAAKQITGESGGNRNAVSSAGARGISQFIPSTRNEVLRKYGVDAYGSPKQAVAALEHYDLDRGVAGYNPGMPTYTKYVLGQKLSQHTRKALKAGDGYTAGDVTIPGPTSHSVTRSTKTIPGESFAAERKQLRDQLFLSGQPLTMQRLLDYAAQRDQLRDVPARTVPGAIKVKERQGAPVRVKGGTPGKHAPTIAKFDGKPVAGWIAPILKRARATGLWKGTVTSGFRTDAEQKRIYDSGVRPAAVPKSEGGSGSNHEGGKFPLGAVDVSDAKGLAAALRQLGIHKLQYAGSKDSVHFSHPHNGGY